MSEVLKVIYYPDPRLREVSTPIENFDDALKRFAQNMATTMYAYRGIGLAAVQVAELKRFFVLDTDWRDEQEDGKPGKKNPQFFVNPELLSGEGDVLFEEGCLSIPQVYGEVKRFEQIHVRFYDLNNRKHEKHLEGIDAIAFQHELDHLNGALFFDHLSAFKRRMLLEKYTKQQRDKLKDEEDE